MEKKSLFIDFKLNPQLQNAIKDCGFHECTPIQEKAIPLALAGNDIIGVAQTGTGKTAAYLIPLLFDLKYRKPDGLRGLILVPTRELASQVKQHCEQLSTYTDLEILSIVGGSSPKKDIERVNAGVDILISTPGRLLDVYQEGYIQLRKIEFLVMDEADKMMDMGFMPQLNSILEIIPRKRQNLLFSATFSKKIEALSHNFLEYPTKVEITPSATPVETVSHYVYELPNLKSKTNLLLEVLKERGDEKTLVFCRSKKIANEIGSFLTRKLKTDTEFHVRVIHGNKDQNSRINAINSFDTGDTRILVSTDVVARGIDIKNVTLVINFNVPIIYEEYVHRIGRTGRALSSGLAYTFADPSELYHLKKIENVIKQKIIRLPCPEALIEDFTPKEERQQIARSIDFQRRRENPNFKGAFHEKKRKSKTRKK